MSVSKKIRFEVFKRDGFRCQYCGSNPTNPDVILEVDHIIPVARGGPDDIDNLLTACFSCNRGKGANELTSIPLSIEEKLQNAREKELQYSQYLAYFNEIEDRVTIQINSIERIYSTKFPEWEFSPTFKTKSVRLFLKRLPFNVVIEAMQLACLKDIDSGATLKYFCGVCWHSIKEKQ